MGAEIQYHINKFSYVLQPYLSLVLKLGYKIAIVFGYCWLRWYGAMLVICSMVTVTSKRSTLLYKELKHELM